jgi:hypothetical protein
MHALARPLALFVAWAPFAAPLSAQAFFLPDHAIGAARPAGMFWVAGSYARFSPDGGTAFESYGGELGWGFGEWAVHATVSSTRDSGDISIGAGAANTYEGDDVPLSVSFQYGLAWRSFDVIDDTFTELRLPVGVVLGGPRGPSADIRFVPWIFPHLDMVRRSGGGGDAVIERDFSLSGGISINLPYGFGLHGAADAVWGDRASWAFSAGAQFGFGGP